MNGSRSEEYKTMIEPTLKRIDALITRVKTCVNQKDRLNELIVKRTNMQMLLKSKHAVLSPRRLEHVRRRISVVRREIEDMNGPFLLAERDVKGFIVDMTDLLCACPLDPQFLAIRSEITNLELFEAGDGFAPLNFTNSERDLVNLRRRLVEMLDLLNPGVKKRGVKNEGAILNIPPGANWGDVEIRFLGDHRIRVSVLNSFDFRNYAEAGFEDSRTNNPTVAWEVLRDMARNSGTLQRPKSLPQLRRLEKAVQVLRKKLPHLLGLPGDPFLPYREVKCYRAKFRIIFPKSDEL